MEGGGRFRTAEGPTNVELTRGWDEPAHDDPSIRMEQHFRAKKVEGGRRGGVGGDDGEGNSHQFQSRCWVPPVVWLFGCLVNKLLLIEVV